MDRDELMTILPHRGKMLLLDSARCEGGAARGEYRVRGDEWFLDGHFPGDPIVPGVVLCEILAQSACVLLGAQGGHGSTLFTGLNNVRFRHPVRPGDTVETSCALTRSKPPFYFAKGSCRVGGTLCMEAEFSFMAEA